MPGKSSKDAVDASKNVADKDGAAAKPSFLDALKAKGRDVRLDAKLIKVGDDIVALAVRAMPPARNDALMFDASALPGKIMNKFGDKLGFGVTSKYFLAIKNSSTAPGWLYASSMRDHVMRDFVVDTLELPTKFTPLGADDVVLETLYEKLKQIATPTEPGFSLTASAPTTVVMRVRCCFRTFLSHETYTTFAAPRRMTRPTSSSTRRQRRPRTAPRASASASVTTKEATVAARSRRRRRRRSRNKKRTPCILTSDLHVR